jgi:rhodanese-related sulfurtransferase
VKHALALLLSLPALFLPMFLFGSCSQPRRELPAAGDVEVQRLVIDTRLPAEFAAGHSTGALNLQWDWDQLGARVEAYVPDKDRPLALRATNAEEAALAAGLLAERGYTDVTLPVEGEDIATLETMSAGDLAAAMKAGTDLVILDVREPWEHLVRTIPGARLLDPDEAPSVLAELDPNVHYAVICEGGYRSSQMASWMQRAGLKATNVIDGMAGWRALPAEELPSGD